MAAAVLTLLSLIYLGGLAALLCVAYSRHHFNRYTAVKAAVSCGFLVIAATEYLLGGHTADAYFRGLLPCFVLCLACLLYTSPVVIRNDPPTNGKVVMRTVSR